MKPEPVALVISNHLAHPRHARRVDMMDSVGLKPIVVGYMRDAYRVSGMAERAGVEVLDDVARGRYHERLPKLWRGRRRILDLLEAEAGVSVIWAFGLDAFLLGALVRRAAPGPQGDLPKLVLELGDLRGRASKTHWSATRIVNRVMERFATSVADGVVVTSPGHMRALGATSAESLVVLNRLPAEWSDPRPEKVGVPNGRAFRMGVIGFFRYGEVLSRLIEGVERAKGAWEVHFHGDGHADMADWVQQMCRSVEYCHYHGPYRNPSDLADVYASVDAVWAVYNDQDENVKLAIPNKLFEAFWFGKPIMVARGTAASELGRELGGGLIEVDGRSTDDIAAALGRLDHGVIGHLGGLSRQVGDQHLQEEPRELAAFLKAIGAFAHAAGSGGGPAEF